MTAKLQKKFMFHLLVFICLRLGRMVGVFADSGVVKSVVEGDLVTLDSGVAEIQARDRIIWQFGTNKTHIARINKRAGTFSTSDGDAVGFRDRLKLDNQTGSLTIMNTSTADSGLYQPVIRGQTKTKYTVIVYAHLPVPVIISNPLNSSSSHKCSVSCSVVNVSAVSLSWYKGNSLFSSISVSDHKKSLPLDLKCLDDSYSCVVNISITKQTTLLLNTEHCQPCPATTAPGPKSTSQSTSPPPLSSTEPKTASAPPNLHVMLISAAAVAVSLLTVAIVGIIWICRNPQKTDKKETVQQQTSDDHHDDEVTYANPTFYKTNAQKSEDEVVYAGIVTRR